MKYTAQNEEFLELLAVDATNCHKLKEARQSQLSILWFTSTGNRIKIDSVDHTFNQNAILCLTEFHKIEPLSINKLILLRWNRSFYCIADHDSEISCKGLLFYGAAHLPIITLNNEYCDIWETVMKMFKIEMNTWDNLQHQMLQMMLKRTLILTARVYKSQEKIFDDPPELDIIREYNYLVELHFKEKHAVKDYADMLFRSPKTLSNLFKKSRHMSPSQVIQNRIIIEAQRQLIYTDQSISDIAEDLGFTDIQVFSRFFKKREGISPRKYRTREKMSNQ